MGGRSTKLNDHIVFLTPGFPAHEDDGNCVPYLQLFIEHLAQRFPIENISVIALQYPHHKCVYRWRNIKIYGCGGHDRKFPFRIISWKRCLNFFKEINRANPVGIIHSFWLNECAFLGEALSRKYHIKSLCTLMGQDVMRPNIYFKLLPLSKMRLIAVSEFQKQIFFKETGLQTPAVIPWGVDPAQQTEISDSSRIDILGVGSLSSLKNYDLFIEIINEIKKIHPAIRAQIIGDGPERGALQNKIEALKLNDTISLSGKMPHKEVLSIMRQSSILLHTSSYESFGYVFAEALAAGMHIVSFEVGIAMPEKNWRVCNSRESMVEAVNFFMEKRQHKTISPLKYSVEETTTSYLETYRAL